MRGVTAAGDQGLDLGEVTPMIITYNEAANIERTLAPLAWARRILVIDSGSTDGTLEMLARHAAVEVVQRPFDSFAAQCNFGLAHIGTEWVLSMDADYVLSPALVDELSRLPVRARVAGFRAPFIYCVHGRRLRASLYPPRTVLYRARAGRYVDEGHGHRLVIAGEVASLENAILHDDRKPLSRWLAAQQRYAEAEASFLLGGGPEQMTRRDRLRRRGWLLPLLILPYVLLVKGCALDGRAGWHYALQRWVAEVMIALALADARLRRTARDDT